MYSRATWELRSNGQVRTMNDNVSQGAGAGEHELAVIWQVQRAVAELAPMCKMHLGPLVWNVDSPPLKRSSGLNREHKALAAAHERVCVSWGCKFASLKVDLVT